MTTGSYRALAGLLRRRIVSGALAPNTRLPTERELSERHGVSRVTVRRALRLLTEEQLIRRLQGSGTYVMPRPPRRIPLRIDYSASMAQHAPALRRTVTACRTEAADAALAADLNVPAGTEILVFERTDANAQTPIACDNGFIPLACAEGLNDEELARVDFLEAWTQRRELPVGRCEQEIEAVAANADLARRLRVPRGTALLCSRERYYASSGRLLGLFVSYYNPQYISIKATFNWEKKP